MDFLLTNPHLQKSTLLVKILSDDSEIQNLPVIHLPIYKKFFILGSFSQIFINRFDFPYFRLIFDEKSTLLVKICETDPKMKIFLYIGKWITGKFSILGLSDHFLKGS